METLSININLIGELTETGLAEARRIADLEDAMIRSELQEA